MNPPPISKLPFEVLEHIFSLCVTWLYPDVTTCQYVKHPIAFTEVCHTWHWTALSSPRLWAVIDLANEPLTHFAIHARTRSPPHINAPFSVISTAFLRTTVAHVHSAFSVLADYSSETQEKRIAISTIDVCLYPRGLFSLLTHLIEPFIDLSNVTKLVLRIPPMSAPSSDLRLPILIGNVRHLDLDGVSVEWSSLRNLRHLALRGLGSGPESGLNLNVFRSLLHRSRMTLRYCRLEGIGFPREIAYDDDISMGYSREEKGPQSLDSVARSLPIPFLCLHTLSISASPSTVASVLHALSLNPATHIQLYTSLQDDLHTLFNPNFLLDEATNVLRLSRYSATFIRANGDDLGSPAETHDVAFSISSAFRYPLPSSILNSMMTSRSYTSGPSPPLKICQGIYPFSSLTSLTLAPGVLLDVTQPALNRLFDGTDGVVKLRVLRVGFQPDEGMNKLLKALLPQSLAIPTSSVDHPLEQRNDDAIDNNVQPPKVSVCAGLGRCGSWAAVQLPLPCPNLHTLSFNTLTSEWPNFTSTCLDAVLEVVEGRGGRLQRLEFFKCSGVLDADFVNARMATLFGVENGLREGSVKEVVVV